MKAFYLLQITKQKLNHESFKKLKALLHYILNQNKEITDIIIEVYFEEQDFGNNYTNHTVPIVQLIVNGYNLLEPEHSKNFPLVNVDIYLPQLFSTRSALLIDPAIRHVYFNEQTNLARADSIICERNASQALPKLEFVCPISKIVHKAMVLSVDIEYGNLNLFEKEIENPIPKLFKYN